MEKNIVGWERTACSRSSYVIIIIIINVVVDVVVVVVITYAIVCSSVLVALISLRQVLCP